MLNRGLLLLASAMTLPAESPTVACSLPTDGK